jgi:hypothetical protein
MDRLLRAHAAAFGIESSFVLTNARRNLGDGGVDAQVRAAADDDVGWMATPTFWQFKARGFRDLSPALLAKDLEKGEARRLLDVGYAYRVCVSDSAPPAKVNKWESELDGYARSIRADARPVRILTADALAAWASRFWALCLEYSLGAQNVSSAIPHDVIGEQLSAIVRTYVADKSRETIAQALRRHADLRVSSAGPVLVVAGSPGVGKTRLVYEALAGESANGQMQLWIDEANAEEFVKAAVRDSQVRAVIVVDDCPRTVRQIVENWLRGNEHRLRAIVLDNESPRTSLIGPDQHWLADLSGESLATLLERNWPNIEVNRRRRFAQISQGSVRFAADLCHQNAWISEAQLAADSGRVVDAYYQNRLGSEKARHSLEAIAIFTKVGCASDVRNEIEAVARFVGYSTEHLLADLGKIKERPGFCARTSRYVYVSPEVVSSAAFDHAWRRWIEPDISRFVGAIDGDLLDAFLRKATRVGSATCRAAISSYFKGWASELSGKDLSDPIALRTLFQLVELEAPFYVVALERVISQATVEQLRHIPDSSASRAWWPLRHLYLLLETLVEFPEYFAAAEAILFRLSQAQAGLSSGARDRWQHLFEVHGLQLGALFPERLKVLERRMESSASADIALVQEAVQHLFNTATPRRDRMALGDRVPPVAAGSAEERRQWIAMAAGCLIRAANLGLPDLRYRALWTAVNNLEQIIDAGAVAEARRIFEGALRDDLHARLVGELQRVLHRTRRGDHQHLISAESIAVINEWLEVLAPETLHGRLVRAFGAWSVVSDREEQLKEHQLLVEELLRDRNLLLQELRWLSGSACAEEIGELIGERDREGHVLEAIFEAAVEGSGFLAMGYVRSNLVRFTNNGEAANKALDRLERRSETAAHNVMTAQPRVLQAAARAIGRIDRDEPNLLSHLADFILAGSESEAEVSRHLGKLHALNLNGRLDAIPVILRILGALTREDEDSGSERDQGARLASLLKDDATRSIMWDAVEADADAVMSSGGDWVRVLDVLSSFDALRAARAATRALGGRGWMAAHVVMLSLTSLASRYPRDVMTAIGETIADPARSQLWRVGKCRDLIETVGSQIVEEWLELHGTVEVARVLARHLPPPAWVGDRLMVPGVTEYVLSRYEDDEVVFREFCAGVHHLQLYGGESPGAIARQHDDEARLAHSLLNHRTRRVREWAVKEIGWATERARAARTSDEENGLD